MTNIVVYVEMLCFGVSLLADKLKPNHIHQHFCLDSYLQGLEIVFRVGLAILQMNQTELIQLDMEGMLQVCYRNNGNPHTSRAECRFSCIVIVNVYSWFCCRTYYKIFFCFFSAYSTFRRSYLTSLTVVQIRSSKLLIKLNTMARRWKSKHNSQFIILVLWKVYTYLWL